MTRDEIKAILYSINANYPNVKTTPEEAKNRLDLWVGAFGAYDPETIKQAVILHITDKDNGRFYPTIANITAKIQSATNLIAYSRQQRAIVQPGIKQIGGRRNCKTLEFCERAFDTQGATFYDKDDVPFDPGEEVKT